MRKVINYLSICLYYRFRTIKNCDEAKKKGLKFSHNSRKFFNKNTISRSFWYDKYDILYKVNEPYLIPNPKAELEFDKIKTKKNQ